MLDRNIFKYYSYTSIVSDNIIGLIYGCVMEGNMKFDYNLLILLLINFFLLFIVIGVVFKVVRGYKAHVDRNKKIEQKFDEILNEFIIKTLNNSK